MTPIIIPRSHVRRLCHLKDDVLQSCIYRQRRRDPASPTSLFCRISIPTSPLAHLSPPSHHVLASFWSCAAVPDPGADMDFRQTYRSCTMTHLNSLVPSWSSNAMQCNTHQRRQRRCCQKTVSDLLRASYDDVCCQKIKASHLADLRHTV